MHAYSLSHSTGNFFSCNGVKPVHVLMYDGTKQSFTNLHHLTTTNIVKDSWLKPSKDKGNNSTYDYIYSQVVHIVKELICFNTLIRGVIKTTSCLVTDSRTIKHITAVDCALVYAVKVIIWNMMVCKVLEHTTIYYPHCCNQQTIDNSKQNSN